MNTLTNPSKWDYRFLEMAQVVASWSKDRSTKVGSVIADPLNRVVSVGFNGFPTGVYDDMALYNNRAEKYKRVIHAEQNAILFANTDLEGCTIYTHPMMPCSSCALIIIQSGITRIVSYEPAEDQARWKESFDLSLNLFEEAGIMVDLIPME